MAAEVFLDTGGLFAALVKRDSNHQRAREYLIESGQRRQRFRTTDYVLDETATLLKMRGSGHLAAALFHATSGSRACTVEWTGAERFEQTKTYFLGHADQGYSFTDCLSFVTMAKHGIVAAFATDRHFVQAGFLALLADAG